jgi:hypothetical protein
MNDKQAVRYRYNETRFNEQVAKFRDAENVDLREELALAKAMLNELVDCDKIERQRTLPAVRDCLKVIASLSESEMQRRLRENELLTRSALEKFATAVCNLVVDCLKEKFPDWESTVDEITSRLDECVAAASNEPERKRRA